MTVSKQGQFDALVMQTVTDTVAGLRSAKNSYGETDDAEDLAQIAHLAVHLRRPHPVDVRVSVHDPVRALPQPLGLGPVVQPQPIRRGHPATEARRG